jgi:hypothetical protein
LRGRDSAPPPTSGFASTDLFWNLFQTKNRPPKYLPREAAPSPPPAEAC